jgi:hypothetical protein
MSEIHPLPKRKLSKELSEKFYSFITDHPPERVSRHLRTILLDYIGYESEIGLPIDFNIYLLELNDLFDLLDCAVDEKIKALNKNVVRA